MKKNLNRVAAGRWISGHNTPKTCPVCGSAFLGTGKQVYCSRSCQTRRPPRPARNCPVCQSPLDRTPRPGLPPVYCSARCRKAACWRATAKACPVCSTSFTPARGKGKQAYCSPACKNFVKSAARVAARWGTPGQAAARLAAELENRK